MSDSKQIDEGKKLFKRRVFGRGTIFLIMSLLVIGGWRLLHPPKVMIERQVETSETNFKRKPAVSDLLTWSEDLSLRAVQKEALKKLLNEEQVKLKPIDQEIGKVTQVFNQFATKHAGEPSSLKELQGAAQPISELSLEKRLIEQGFAERGLGVLDEAQKKKAGQLWEAKLAQLKDGKKEVSNP